MSVDLTQAPVDILLGLINNENLVTLPRPILDTEAVFGDPIPFGGQGANTQIPFGTNNPAEFGAGTVLVYYTRIDVGQQFAPLQPVLGSGIANISDLLPQLNAEYSLNILAADIVDGPIDTEATPVTVTFIIVPHSQIYTGRAVMIFGDPDLGNAITTTVLPGLNPPESTGSSIPSGF
jgi:hypothetical protein